MASATDLALYIDSSAIVKLVVAEDESGALQRVVAGRDLVTSELALAEVPRAVRRVIIGRQAAEQQALGEQLAATMQAVAFVPLDRALLVRAGAFAEAWLRTLDAIHVAAALAVADELEAVVTYDERQREAMEATELPVIAPR